jgi:hypothetical protein
LLLLGKLLLQENKDSIFATGESGMVDSGTSMR